MVVFRKATNGRTFHYFVILSYYHIRDSVHVSVVILYHNFIFNSITKLQLAMIVTIGLHVFIRSMRVLKSLHCLPVRYRIIFKFIVYFDEKGCLASIISL